MGPLLEPTDPLPPIEDASRVQIELPEVTLGGYLLRASASRRAVLILHGRGEDATSHVDAARAFRQRGFHALTLSMRGSRGSGGENDYALHQPGDVPGVLAWLRRHTGAEECFLFGYSQGGMVSLIALGQGAEVRAAATLNTPGDLRSFARDTAFDGVRRFVQSACADGHWDKRSPLRWTHRVQVPVLLCVSTEDYHVPSYQGLLLHAALPGSELYPVQGAAHKLSETQAPLVWAEVASFFEQYQTQAEQQRSGNRTA